MSRQYGNAVGHRRPLRPARRAGFLHATKTSRPSSPRPGRCTTTPSRTGVRLIGPKPQWARRDGGEAGLHPSNIHDNAYAIGAIDFTGDMPIILGPDGPSLGGFVCPACVVAGRALEDRPAPARRHASASAASPRPRPSRCELARTSDRAAARPAHRACFACRLRRGRRHAAPAGARRRTRHRLPRGRRPLPARRVRPARAGSRAALPRPCAA